MPILGKAIQVLEESYHVSLHEMELEHAECIAEIRKRRFPLLLNIEKAEEVCRRLTWKILVPDLICELDEVVPKLFLFAIKFTPEINRGRRCEIAIFG